MPSHNEILSYLYGLQRLGIKPGLRRIRALLRFLGDPQKEFRSIHIAGTNGKGSTSAIIFSILNEAGYHAGLYTSPHLIRFNERIRTSNGLITDRDIVRAATAVREAARAGGIGDAITFFEFTTAMAFEHFRQKKIDVAAIEAGMGGRWDATNVVTPLVSVITNIGLDHTKYLGENIRQIAGEKAGIIKKSVPVITGEDKKSPFLVLKRAAREKRAPVFQINRDFSAIPCRLPSPYGIRFDYTGINWGLDGLALNLRGPYQYKNAACALAALEASDLKIPQKAIEAGLKNVDWPGRVEVVRKSPLIILDAAHNPDGALALAAALREFRYRRLFLVLGIMADKDIGGILKKLVPLSNEVILTAPDTERAATTGLLSSKLKPFGKTPVLKRSVKDACKAALEMAGRADAICITGSIFTIGEAKKFFSEK